MCFARRSEGRPIGGVATGGFWDKEIWKDYEGLKTSQDLFRFEGILNCLNPFLDPFRNPFLNPNLFSKGSNRLLRLPRSPRSPLASLASSVKALAELGLAWQLGHLALRSLRTWPAQLWNCLATSAWSGAKVPGRPPRLGTEMPQKWHESWNVMKCQMSVVQGPIGRVQDPWFSVVSYELYGCLA